MFKELTLIQKGSNYYVDSREVAELIGKRHHDLLRDISRYAQYMGKITESKIAFSDFFLESSYLDRTGRRLKCYLLSKMGCAMVANKLTGEKGVIFTAAYVSKFNAMESQLRAEWEKSKVLLPTLADCNDTAKIVIDQLKRTGATTYRILDFLGDLYEPLGIGVTEEGEFDDIPQTYTALQIAWLCGVYSLYGNPHAHAVSCIINENLFICDKHKCATSENYMSGITSGMRYDEHTLEAVKQWLSDCGYPRKIYSSILTYHVIYRNK